MKNKIILSTGSLFFLPLEKIINIAKAAGFDGIELMVDQTSLTRDDKKLIKLSKKYSLPILAIHAPHDKYDCFSQTANGIVGGSMALAKKLKAQVVVIHPARIALPEYSNDLKKLDLSDPIVVENLPDNGRLHSSDQNYVRPLFVNNIFDNICLDTSHLATSGGDFKKQAMAMLPKIRHIHFSDNALKINSKNFIEDSHLLPSEGKLPLKWLLRELSKIDYRGFISLELLPNYFSEKSPNDIIRILRESLRYIRDSI